MFSVDFNDFCGFLLISVDFCGFLLIYVDFLWFLWISDFFWISKDFYQVCTRFLRRCGPLGRKAHWMRQNTPYILWWQYKVSRSGRKGSCQLLCIYIHPLFIRVKAPWRTAILKWRFHQSSLAKINVPGKFNLFSILCHWPVKVLYFHMQYLQLW